MSSTACTSSCYARADARPNALSRWLASQPGAIVFQWPAADPAALPGPDPSYLFESTKHWRVLINGYAAFYPAAYLALLDAVRDFPSADALDAVSRHGATHVVVHPWRMTPAQFEDVKRDVASRGLPFDGCFDGPFGRACVYRLMGRAQGGTP